MKHWHLVAALICLCSQADAAYLKTIFQDPTHPQISADALFTPRFEFDAAATQAAVVFHSSDPNETLLPKVLLDLGVQPISWSLLDIGVGGNKNNAIVPIGASVNLSPAILGPLVSKLREAGSTTAQGFGKILVSPDGSGVRLGIRWVANPIADGNFQPANKWRFAPRFSVGGLWKF